MRATRRTVVRVALVVVLVSLSGCSFVSRVGVRAGADHKPTVVIARCTSDVVTSVELHDGRLYTDPVIWRVESLGQPVDEVEVGVVPSGFQETVPLTTIVRSDSQYLVTVRDSSVESEVFTPGLLESGQVLVNGGFVDLNTFRARAGGSCSNGLNGAALAAVIALFLVFGVAWVFGIVFWIVKIVQVARIPDYQYRAAGSEKTTWVLIVVLTQAIGALIWHFGPRKRVLAAQGLLPPPPPGWYPTPQGTTQWWDGQRWISPLPPPPPSGPPPPPAPPTA